MRPSEWASHWATLSPRKRRCAEESYIIQYDSEELSTFHAELSFLAILKRELVNEWGSPTARHSANSGIVVPPATIAALVDQHGRQAASRVYQKVLFVDPAYPAYVQHYTQQLLAMPARAPTPLAVSALLLVNRYYWSAALARTCRTLSRDSDRLSHPAPSLCTIAYSGHPSASAAVSLERRPG